MKQYILLLAVLLISSTVCSQSEYSTVYNKVNAYEMGMTKYDKDTDAEAVVIYDFGEYSFIGEDGFNLVMERCLKIKILTEAGVKYATHGIPYYFKDNRTFETIEGLEATTYNMEDGKLIKTTFDSKNIFDEKINKNWSQKKITLSDVRPGSVIEIKYRIYSPFLFNMHEWKIQRRIPVVMSELKYRAIPYYEYVYHMKGASKLGHFTSKEDKTSRRYGNLAYTEMVHTMGMNNIPAFKDESFMTSEKDYMISINFQMSKFYSPSGGSNEIISTWPALNNELLKHNNFGKYIKKSEKEAKKILLTLDIGGKTDIEKAKIITQYVKRNYNWNGFRGKYSSGNLAEFMKQKTGSIGDINQFLIGLLQAAKLEVNPVILSTRGNGQIYQPYPFDNYFDYVLAEVIVEGKKHYLDASESLLYFDELPARCTNVLGLVVKPKIEEWTSIQQQSVATTTKTLLLDILPEESRMKVKASYVSKGDDAYQYRSTYLGKTENLKKWLQDNKKLVVDDNIEVDEYESFDEPFKFTFNFDSQLEQSSDKIFISPFSGLGISDNPFKQSSRTLPIDMLFIRGEVYNVQFLIPEGYKIESVPSSVQRDDRVMSISYNVQVDGNKVFLSTSYRLKSNMYDAKDYLNLKISFSDIIKKMSEMVVLVKE